MHIPNMNNCEKYLPVFLSHFFQAKTTQPRLHLFKNLDGRIVVHLLFPYAGLDAIEKEDIGRGGFCVAQEVKFYSLILFLLQECRQFAAFDDFFLMPSSECRYASIYLPSSFLCLPL